MNRLRLAQQGFESLSQSLNTALDEAASDRVEAWLRDEVCPVVAELVRYRGFQLTTRWSVDHLSPGVDTSERRLVEDVDRELVRCATGLTSVIGNRVQSSDVPPNASPREISDDDRATLELIAERPWFDLVCPEEFFHAYRDLHLNESDMSHINAFRQRELRVPLGDYVSRSMFARVDYWKTILDRLWNEVSSALSSGTDEAYRASERLFDRKIELDRAVNSLNEVCNQEQRARRREACTALTLVYAAYAPQPYLDWLGCPPSWWQTSAHSIRSCIRRRGVTRTAERGPRGRLRVIGEQAASLCDPDTVRQIAGALQDVTTFYEVPEDPDDLIEWAQDRTRLVLVDRSPREVFWDGLLIAAAAWDNCSVEWNLLWTLARNAGHVVDQGMLQHRERHRIGSRRGRVSELLLDCQELDALIVNVRGQGYRLDLEADDIILLQDNGPGRLEFVGPRGSPQM